MTESGQTVSPALRDLRDGKLTGSWVLDGDRSEIGLQSRSMWGLVPVKGVFREVTGSGTVSEAGDVAGTVTVAAASIDTKTKKRDDHLRSADFFDVANTPDITFTVEQVTPSGDGVTVAGALTVAGRTRPASFPARVTVLDGTRLELDGVLRVNRTDFGLTWSQLGMASVHNTITVHAVFTRQ